MVKKWLLSKFNNWLQRFLKKSENDYRNANIAGVLEKEDRELMKDFRKAVKKVYSKVNGV